MNVIKGDETSPIEISGEYDKDQFFRDCRINLIRVGLIEQNRNRNDYVDLDETRITLDRFLNRILGMNVTLQNALFQYFFDTMDAYIRHAKRLGLFDIGIKEFRSDITQIEISRSQTFLKKYENMQAMINLHEVMVNRGMSWEDALEIIGDSNDLDEGFYESRADNLSRRSIVLAIRDSGSIFRIYKPNLGREKQPRSLINLRSNFKLIRNQAIAEQHWKGNLF